MKAIINSVKHIVQTTLTTLEEQTATGITIANAVTTEPTTPTHVVVGSVIKAVFCELWLVGESAQVCTATWNFEKLEGGASNITQAQMQDLHDYPNKRNLLKIGQGVIGDNNSNPIPILREWIKIPKGKQRMAQSDILKINLSCVGEVDNGLEFCGTFVYKEYQ